MAQHGLTLFDYLVLSALSMSDDDRMRMSDLAEFVNASPSRLSNVVKRFEQRGWVERTTDPADGRCTVAALTPVGRDLVVAAAPTHVRSVRDAVIDPLDADQQAALSSIAHRLAARMTGADGSGCTGEDAAAGGC
ncbi:MAG TPA: MarR family winged helix-turn-helix transcriptional regulator [Nocardioides sp.]